MDNEEAAANVEVAQIFGAAGQQAMSSAAAQVYLDEQSKALAEKQLDVKKIRRECYYLLKQYSWNPSEDGNVEWGPPQDIRKTTLTEWGVDRIMQIIHFFINESNLLSNFSEEQINYLMLKFLSEMNDLMLLKYEFLFRIPDFDEAKEILEAKIKERKKLKVFTFEVLGKKVTSEQEKKIEDNLYLEIEKTIEAEIDKIRKESKRERIREYGMLIAQLEVIVLGALSRALNGEERGSLRRHTQMLEMLGGGNQITKENSSLLSKWMK